MASISTVLVGRTASLSSTLVISYHTLQYWARYRDVPPGVLAHRIHMRGPSVMDDEAEKLTSI